MNEMTITEDQMTFTLKEFLRQYKGNFSHVSFDRVEGKNGFLVNFHLGENVSTKQDEKSEQNNSSCVPDLWSPLNPASPISVWNDFGVGDSTPSVPVPDFGGGLSGGGGADGSW